ncbi:MAG: hypothetical protein HQK50_02340 [Oligoflexia bacterium]|nr:hypothetical protein [Oligoflexia bacterium]
MMRLFIKRPSNNNSYCLTPPNLFTPAILCFLLFFQVNFPISATESTSPFFPSGDVVNADKLDDSYRDESIDDEEMGQDYFISGSGREKKQEEKGETPESVFIQEGVRPQQEKVFTKEELQQKKRPHNYSNYLPEEEVTEVKDKQINEMDKVKSESGYVQDWNTWEGRAKPNTLYEEQGSDLLRSLRHRGNYNLNVAFFKDGSEYASNNKVLFERTFRREGDSTYEGVLHFSSYKIYNRKLGVFGVGAGGSIGYNSGYAYFVDGNKSSTKVILWTIPFDAGASYEIPIANALKVGGAAGPSIMSLIQNRSDGGNGVNKKDVWQASYGYFALAHLKFNLSTIFGFYSARLLRTFSVASVYGTIFYRHQEYSKFKQKDIKISGDSLGIGLTYEYF